jgi:hypothetical protein
MAELIHTGTQDCKACDPIRAELAEKGLPTCMGWQRVSADSNADDDVSGCVDCGASIPASGKRGRPAVRCEACRK